MWQHIREPFLALFLSNVYKQIFNRALVCGSNLATMDLKLFKYACFIFSNVLYEQTTNEKTTKKALQILLFSGLASRH